MRSFRWLFVLWAFGACDPDDSAVVSNGSLWVPAAGSVTVVSQDPADPASLLVRRIGDLGVAVGEGTTTIEVDGVGTSIPLDVSGYGSWDLGGPGSFTVAEAAGGWAHVPGGTWTDPNLPEAVGGLGAPAMVEPGKRGVLASLGSSLWWVGRGLAPHAVATMPATIRGIRSRNLDSDGLPDTLVWAADTVLALRGREAGGAGWGAAWRAEGWTAIAADVGDADDDGTRDVAILWETPEGSVLQVWSGDGVWGFTPLMERRLVGTALDVTAAKDVDRGSTTVTVLIQDAPWQRFVQSSDGGFAVTGPAIETRAGPGTVLRAVGDLNGDGGEELVVVPPREQGVPRTFAIWDLVGDQPLVVSIEESGAPYTVADSDGDARPDLWLLDDGSLDLSILVHDGGGFVTRDSGQVAHIGPIAAPDVDDDQVPDLLIAGEMWSWWRGTRDSEAADRWRPELPSGSVYELGLIGPITAVDVDPDVDEILGVTAVDGAARLTRFSLLAEGPRVVSQIPLPGTTAAVADVAVCGTEAWLSTGAEVVQVDLRGGRERGRLPIAGAGLGCGEGPDGLRAAVATNTGLALLGDGAIRLGDQAGTAFLDAVVTLTGAAGCTSRCTLWEGPNGAVLVRSEGSTLIIGEGTETIRVSGGADFSVQDVDLDGRADILTRAEGGFIGVLRAAPGGLAPTRWQYGGASWTGAPVAGTLPSGGRGLWFAREGDLVRTR